MGGVSAPPVRIYSTLGGVFKVSPVLHSARTLRVRQRLTARMQNRAFLFEKAMNLYTYQFIAACPTNGEQIVYTLDITSEHMIHVEKIKTACALHRHGYHEAIADSLADMFKNCLQVLKANHHGVQIETMRGAL